MLIGWRSRKVAELADERADQVERLDLQLVARRVDVLAQLGAHDREHDERPLASRRARGSGGPPPSCARACAAGCARPSGELQHRRAHDLLRRLARRVAQDVDALRGHLRHRPPAHRHENRRDGGHRRWRTVEPRASTGSCAATHCVAGPGLAGRGGDDQAEEAQSEEGKLAAGEGWKADARLRGDGVHRAR